MKRLISIILIMTFTFTYGCATTTTTKQTIHPSAVKLTVEQEKTCYEQVAAQYSNTDKTSFETQYNKCLWEKREQVANKINGTSTTTSAPDSAAIETIGKSAVGITIGLGLLGLAAAIFASPPKTYIVTPRHCNFWRCW